MKVKDMAFLLALRETMSFSVRYTIICMKLMKSFTP